MRKTFKYRLYPTATQQKLREGQLSEACRLYNAALQERREAYKHHGVSLNYYHQANQLKEIRDRGDFGLRNYRCCQNVLKLLDKSSAAFFDRVKQGQRAGFPRFKSHRRYDRITFPSYGDGNKIVDEGHLRMQDVGAIKVKLCPECHSVRRKSLSERIHRCAWGLTLGRDHAAALLILGRGLRLQAQTKPEVRANVV